MTHIRPPLLYWGGPLMLLALLRWRRPEARLLAALSCVPHTPELYESLYLFLVPASMWQGALLAALNYGIVFARRAVPPPADYVGDMMATGQWKGAGVFNMEQLDPDPFLADVAKRGLPWHVEER